MKALMFILLFSAGFVFADDLLTKEGTVYENVTIISADPVRMLIVHDGGGYQLKYTDLAEGTLSSNQKSAIADGLKEYAQREIRIEDARAAAEIARADHEAFEQAQRERGLIQFEDAWMTPQDRQDILAGRELDRLKQERLAVELEKEKADLRRSQLLAEQEQAHLITYEQPRTIVYSSYYPSRSRDYACRYPSKKSYTRSSGLRISASSSGSSITYRSSTPSYSRVSVPVVGCRTR